MESCRECDFPGDGFLKGNGKCNQCHGSGIEDFIGGLVESVIGNPYNCERCGGTGVCSRCDGEGEHD